MIRRRSGRELIHQPIEIDDLRAIWNETPRDSYIDDPLARQRPDARCVPFGTVHVVSVAMLFWCQDG